MRIPKYSKEELRAKMPNNSQQNKNIGLSEVTGSPTDINLNREQKSPTGSADTLRGCGKLIDNGFFCGDKSYPNCGNIICPDCSQKDTKAKEIEE